MSAPTSVRRAARRREIDRDQRLLTADLLDALLRIAETGASEAPVQLWRRVEDALQASRDAHRELNNTRISLRARRNVTYSDSMALPASLGAYRHRGNYRGAFRSLAELGNVVRGALDIAAGLTPLARARIARECHLRGELWTLEHEGAVHVFGRPGSAVDLFLASERPPIFDPNAILTPPDRPASPTALAERTRP